jgi:hypothetical protein
VESEGGRTEGLDRQVAGATPGPAKTEEQVLARRLRAAQAEQRWQRLVLPFMMIGLVAAAVFFGGTTYVFFDRLQSELAYSRTETHSLIDRVDAGAQGISDIAYRDWAVRATLEQAALQQRFNVQVAIVKGRLWSRFMGFMTGMLLALTGCVFVLGKLRTDIDFSGSASGASAVLRTTSPGVYLALLGTVVIGMALAVPGSVESTDAAIYLPAKGDGAAPSHVMQPPAPLPAADSPASAAFVPPYPSPFARERPSKTVPAAASAPAAGGAPKG